MSTGKGKYMNTIDMIFNAALRYFCKKERNNTIFARKVDLSAPYLNDLLHQKRFGTDDTKRKIAARLGFSGRDYEQFLDIGREILGDSSTQTDRLFSDGVDKLSDRGFYFINYADQLILDENNHVIIDQNNSTTPVLLHYTQCNKDNINNLFAFTLLDNRMSPLITKGSILVVDQSQKTVNNVGIFLFSNPSSPLTYIVSYLSIDLDRDLYIIDAYNRAFKPAIVPRSDLTIIGKVVNVITFFK
jgi:hypothetical protein